MEKQKRFLLFAVSSILIAAGAAVSVQAQRPLNRPAPSPTPRPPITKVPGPVLTRDQTERQVLPPGIWGSIRWNKEMGLPYDASSGEKMSHSMCYVFRPTLSFRESASGPPHLLRGIHFVDGNPTEVNGYYTCNYGERDDAEVPRNQPVTITLDFESRIPDSATAEWVVGSNTKPPPGQQRVIIIIGGQPNGTFTLSDDQPRANVNFEMVYGPIPEPQKKP